MKAIILAAGAGRRLAPIGWTKPKCLLPCPGGTLLGNALRAISTTSIADVVIVTGHAHQQVEAAVTCGATFIHNPEFLSTNTLYSAFLVREHMAGGFLLLNADVWFDSALLTGLTGGLARTGTNAAEALLAVQRKRCGHEEVKVVLDPDGRICRIGKEISGEDASGEYIGVAAFRADSASALINALESLAKSPNGRTHFVEAAVDAILPSHRIMAMVIGDEDAIEIDTPEDYARAQRLWGHVKQ